MKNKRRDIEPLKIRAIAGLEDSYELGYCDGIEDGNNNTHTFEKMVQKAYSNGLNDAWECARKILNAVVPYDYWDIGSGQHISKVIKVYPVTEAIQIIKEYEQQEQDATDMNVGNIKIGDEVINGGVTGVVIHVRDIENGMKAFSVMDKMGKVWNFNDLVIKRTGRHFNAIEEILVELKNEKN